jgi:hypothetical protein
MLLCVSEKPFKAPILERKKSPEFRYATTWMNADKIGIIEYHSSEQPAMPPRRLLVCDPCYAEELEELCAKWNAEKDAADIQTIKHFECLAETLVEALQKGGLLNGKHHA